MRPSINQLAHGVYAALQHHPRAQVVSALAEYLLEHRRSADLPQIIEAMRSVHLQQTGTLQADAFSAHPLPAGLQKELEQTLAQAVDAKAVELTTHKDADLIGGVQMSAGELRLKASIHDQLEQLQTGVRHAGI